MTGGKEEDVSATDTTMFATSVGTIWLYCRSVSILMQRFKKH
jgi:hypothetical protein